jgi:hypothetical protein
MGTPHLTTADDLWKMPRGRVRHEVVRGELRTRPLAGGMHGIISVEIMVSLHKFVKKRFRCRVGDLFPE